MHIEQFLSKFPCCLQQVHLLSSLLMNGTCLSTSIYCGVFGRGGMWNTPYYYGTSRNRQNQLCKNIINTSIELEIIATQTNNNNKDNSIADEHGCFPSQERDGQQEVTVVLTILIGQVYQSFVLTFISYVSNICRDMNELIRMG